MRTMLLIAGLTCVVAATPARSQYYGYGYYGYGYYGPYYPVPYGYDPGPYEPPPPAYDVPPPHRHRAVLKIQHRTVLRRHRAVRQPLINPLLGPLPGVASPRQN